MATVDIIDTMQKLDKCYADIRAIGKLMTKQYLSLSMANNPCVNNLAMIKYLQAIDNIRTASTMMTCAMQLISDDDLQHVEAKQ